MIKERWIVGLVLRIKANLIKTLILTRKFVMLSRKLLAKTAETCSRDHGGLSQAVPIHELGDGERFRGACPEYCPVNKLIAGDVGRDIEPAEMHHKLETNRAQCSSLLTGIVELCGFANELGPENEPDAKRQLENKAKELDLVYRTQIFGFRPECEM